MALGSFVLESRIQLNLSHIYWSSLICNPSARHERQECDTSDTNATRVRHKWHECNTSETRATPVRHKCRTSATRTTRVRHEWKILILIVTRVKTYFHTPAFTTMASERLLRDEQVHSKIYLLEMARSHAKMRLKSAPQKLNFLMAKDISKSYTLDCSCVLMPLHVPA